MWKGHALLDCDEADVADENDDDNGNDDHHQDDDDNDEIFGAADD